MTIHFPTLSRRDQTILAKMFFNQRDRSSFFSGQFIYLQVYEFCLIHLHRKMSENCEICFKHIVMLNIGMVLIFRERRWSRLLPR